MTDDVITQLAAARTNPSIIMVVGVGGAGGNAVNHMWNLGIKGVDFMVCNTDQQALDKSPVELKVRLGSEGLGAGNDPENGRKAAIESLDVVRQRFEASGTKMVFITAGMGGGTGTGASPVIAKLAHEMGILTVGIVTIPFKFEGNKKIDQALDGVDEMAKHVDALLVINNERLRKVYPDLSLLNGFAKADDTLSVAAKSIAEIITVRGLINLDFNDVRTVLKDGGVAIMSTGFGEGEGRVRKAIDDALNSPLLNDNDVYNSQKILLSIAFSSDNGTDGLAMEEMNEINDFMSRFGSNFELKWGIAIDNTLEKKVKITILATGFGLDDLEDVASYPSRLDKARAKEEAQKKAEQEEADAERSNRRDKYYRDNGDKLTKARPHIYLFSQDDLDNEDVILDVESIPTFNRTKPMLNEIKKKSAPEQVREEQPVKDKVEGTIRFE